MNRIISEKSENANLYYINYPEKSFLIDYNRIYTSLGYSQTPPPDGINNIIEESASVIKKLSCLKSGFIMINSNPENNTSEGIILNNTFLNTGKIIASQIKDSSFISIFLCTLGNEVENYIQKLMNDGEIARGYIADTVASTAAENLAGELHNYIRNNFAGDGMKITNRFSPGYCEWDVHEQHKLFSFLPENFCNITLTDTAFMIPRKSVSGIIGIGKNVKYTEYLCEQCTSTNCLYKPTISNKIKGESND